MIDEIEITSLAQEGNEGWRVRVREDGVDRTFTITPEEHVLIQTQLRGLFGRIGP